MIIGPLQTQGPQYAFKCLAMTTTILSRFPTQARQLRPRMIGGVGVQPLLQRSCRQTQGLSPRRYLYRFKIEIPDGGAA